MKYGQTKIIRGRGGFLISNINPNTASKAEPGPASTPYSTGSRKSPYNEPMLACAGLRSRDMSPFVVRCCSSRLAKPQTPRYALHLCGTCTFPVVSLAANNSTVCGRRHFSDYLRAPASRGGALRVPLTSPKVVGSFTSRGSRE